LYVVIARSASDEAIQNRAAVWIASLALAMTTSRVGLGVFAP
jgi:hypothetical protein